MTLNKSFSIVVVILLAMIVFSLLVRSFVSSPLVDIKTLPPSITRFVDGNNVCYVYHLNNGGGIKTINEMSNDQIAISCIKN